MAYHNFWRRKHGCPDLTWSDECFVEAKKQADECQAHGEVVSGNRAGPSGEHGQNIFFCSEPDTPLEAAVESWYMEVSEKSYAWRVHEASALPEALQFTQLVWRSTTSVGMAASQDGRFLVANYFPAGNIPGRFVPEVPPLLGPFEQTPLLF